MEIKPYVDKFLVCALTPAKWMYGLGVLFHNWLYDAKIRKQESFEVPVISVGNLTVGGTGKTPHVEYIVNQLKDRYNIAVLSRGYKRKTSGFILASPTSTPDQIGDEPYQIYRKFGDTIKVAVAKNRRKGIEKVLRLFPDTDLIILDDAYQFRSIKPLISILLLDYHRPIDKDTLLPLGRLREPHHATERADMIVITKCPSMMTPIEFRTYSKSVKCLKFQKLFFSSISFKSIIPVFEKDNPTSLTLGNLTAEDSVLLVTGIAHPRSFVTYFKRFPFKVRVMRFPDHHNFSRRDLEKIKQYYSKMKGNRKLIITTEKDSVRFLHNPYFPHKLKPYIFYLPISINMHSGIDGDILEEQLENAIRNRHLNQ